MRLRLVGTVAVAVLLAFTVRLTFSQPPDIESDTHRVRVVNEMGYPIRVKIVGYQPDATFNARLDEDESVRRNFYAGERVVCVWNRSRKVKMAAIVKFDRSGTLRLREQDEPTYHRIESGN